MNKVKCNRTGPCIYRDVNVNSIKALDLIYGDQDLIMGIRQCKYFHHQTGHTVKFSVPTPILPDSIKNLVNLTTLYIDNYKYNSVINIRCTLLNRFTELTDVGLYGNIILIFDSDIRMPKLSILRLKKCTLSDDNTVYDLLSSLNEYNPNLKDILLDSIYGSERMYIYNWMNNKYYNLEDLPVTDSCTARELPILKMTNLKDITLANCYIDAALPKNLLSRLPALKCIYLMSTVLTGVVQDRLKIDGMSMDKLYITPPVEEYKQYLIGHDRAIIDQALWETASHSE